MSRNDGAPDAWSFSEPAASRRGLSRRAILIVGIVVAVGLLVSGLMVWLSRPVPVAAQKPRFEVVDKPLLNDEPPTVIKNAIEPRTLYPPGYTDRDFNKSGPVDLGLDPTKKYERTVSPPECEKDPLDQVENNLDRKDTERYERYPVDFSMYPVDDPGGKDDDSGVFLISIFPAQDPNSLGALRNWFSQCQSAQVTRTVTQDGRVVETTTEPFPKELTDAPHSVSSDSFTVTRKDKPQDSCNYYGLVRGMIVHVLCSPAQKDAGADLFRTLVQRVYDI